MCAHTLCDTTSNLPSLRLHLFVPHTRRHSRTPILRLCPECSKKSESFSQPDVPHTEISIRPLKPDHFDDSLPHPLGFLRIRELNSPRKFCGWNNVHANPANPAKTLVRILACSSRRLRRCPPPLQPTFFCLVSVWLELTAVGAWAGALF